LDFGHLEFGFVSSFDIRISGFNLLFGDAKTFARLCKEFLGHNTRRNSQIDTSSFPHLPSVKDELLFPTVLSFEVRDQTDVFYVLPDDHVDLNG
jgi:hypothetical protein